MFQVIVSSRWQCCAIISSSVHRNSASCNIFFDYVPKRLINVQSHSLCHGFLPQSRLPSDQFAMDIVKQMKKRNLVGNIALGLYFVALVFVSMSFFSISWVVSDQRISGAKLDRFGLWKHCFHSLPDPSDSTEQTHFVGCHWIFDPFTKGYNKIRGFLLPSFIVATQVLYTITFIGTMLSATGSSMYLLCYKSDEKYFKLITFTLGVTLIISGICAGIAVIIFGMNANHPGWMPGHENNYFGWSFNVAVASLFALIAAGVFYLIESSIPMKNIYNIKKSQANFNKETET